MNSKDSNADKHSNYDLNRKNFLGMASMGVGATLLPNASFGETLINNVSQFLEPAHKLLVVDEVDVIVCGNRTGKRLSMSTFDHECLGGC